MTLTLGIEKWGIRTDKWEIRNRPEYIGVGWITKLQAPPSSFQLMNHRWTKPWKSRRSNGANSVTSKCVVQREMQTRTVQNWWPTHSLHKIYKINMIWKSVIFADHFDHTLHHQLGTTSPKPLKTQTGCSVQFCTRAFICPNDIPYSLPPSLPSPCWILLNVSSLVILTEPFVCTCSAF